MSLIPIMEVSKQILVVIKPMAMAHRANIRRRIEACDYTIIQSKTVILTPEQVAQFHDTYHQSPFYPATVAELADRPICAMYLTCPMAEAGEISHKYRLRNVVLEEYADGVHISENCAREIRFFFGDWKERHVRDKPSIESVAQFLNDTVHPVLMKALWEMTQQRVQPDDCAVQLAKKLMEVDARRDPVNASRWRKYDEIIEEIGELRLALRRRNHAKNASGTRPSSSAS